MLTGGSFHAKNAKFRERASKVTVCEFVMGLETLLLLSQLGFLFFLLLHALKLFFWCLSKKDFLLYKAIISIFGYPFMGPLLLQNLFWAREIFKLRWAISFSTVEIKLLVLLYGNLSFFWQQGNLQQRRNWPKILNAISLSEEFEIFCKVLEGI